MSGPDCMSLAFYQKFWHVVGLSITESCKAWFDEGRLPKQVNGTIFVLIPKKKKNLETVRDLRPISLCNVEYKSFRRS